MQNLDLLAAGEAIEPAAVSRPNIAKFLGNVHISLL